MKYILTAGWDDGVAHLTERLARELAAGKRVLWLVSGGSNVPASVQIMGNISSRLSQNLSVTLVDERYGATGHQASNWAKLMEAGFEAKDAKLLPVLQPDLDFDQTTTYYNQLAKQALNDNDIVIAQLGIGEDGHLAGILPGSPAATENAALAAGYHTPELDRLTLTFPALQRVDAAYAFAFGENKKPALERLRTKSLELAQQPAQILKHLPEAYLYSDQVGSNS